jgi:hypothetical protein
LEGEGDPAFDNLSDSEWEFTEDSPELIAARNQLAAYTYRCGEQEPSGISDGRQALGAVVDSLASRNIVFLFLCRLERSWNGAC